MQKRRYNSKETKMILINAAETLFIKKGFAATSTDEISRLAKSSKSQIQYHFQTKENLWKAVINRRLGAFFEAIEILFESITTDKESLRQGVVQFFGFLKENPQIISIMKWVTIEGVPSNINIKDKTSEVAVNTINRIKDRHVISKEIDPNYLAYAILGLIFHWFDIRGNQVESIGPDTSLDEKDQYYLDTIIEIIYNGIFLKPKSNPHNKI
jgi:AcrR family transcriptional regulator